MLYRYGFVLILLVLVSRASEPESIEIEVTKEVTSVQEVTAVPSKTPIPTDTARPSKTPLLHQSS